MLGSKQSSLNTIALSLIFLNNVSFGMLTPISEISIQKFGEAKKASLFHDGKGFKVGEAGEFKNVPNYLIDKNLRNVNSAQLSKMLGTGYLTLNKNSEGNFTIKHNGRLKGGGPLSGAIAYWVTKTLCYGTAVAAAGTVVVATGGTVGAATGVVASASTLGASAGATLAGAAISGAGYAGAASTATAAVVTGAGSFASAAAAVETASTAVGYAFTVIPWLP